VREALVVTLFQAEVFTLGDALVDDGLGSGAQLLAHRVSLDSQAGR
jgi:hypothetical protein